MISEPEQESSARSETTRPWQPRGRDFNATEYQDVFLAIFASVSEAATWDRHALLRILARHPRDSKGYFSKIELVTAYQQLTAAGLLPFERHVLRRLQMKPVRTSSGVAPVTVLTEPAGCPGRCIFCPDAEGMPKSYLPNEPGARRAAQCGFDPYLQVRTRLETFEAMGHTADKVELLILGGTWSAYSKHYREWFVRRCLDAMNESGQVVTPVQLWNAAASWISPQGDVKPRLVLRHSPASFTRRRRGTRPRRIATSGWSSRRGPIGSRRTRSSTCAGWASPRCSSACRAWTTASWR